MRGGSFVFVALSISVFAVASCSDEPNDVPKDASTKDTSPLPDASPPDDVADVVTPVDAGPEATIVAGAPDRILLIGHVVTPDTDYDGQVLVEQTMITCALPGTACASEPGAAGATIITTNGIIAPGLIDTHNHILFDIFDNDDWMPAKVYANHDEWPNEVKYQAMLDVKQCLENASQGKPTWCASTSYGSTTGNVKCEMNKWGELKALIAGTTSVVGLPGTTSGCFTGLVRSLGVTQNDLGVDKIQTSSLFPPSKASADGVCANFLDGDTEAYLIHVGEGTDSKALGEFAKLGTVSTTSQCLYATQTAITHGTAFGPTEFAQMKTSDMKLTWSPQSNVSLYGKTTDIVEARKAGITISVAPDWSMGGSQNMLDEMRFADTWDNANFGNILTPKDIVQMGTTNAATVTALQTKLGKIEKGYLADIFVIGGDTTKPYDAILAATPKEVRLVLIGGVALYGDDGIKSAGPATPGCESIDICSKQKFVCVATTDTANKHDQTYTTIKSILDKAMTDADTASSGDGFNFSPLAPLVHCK